jgi:predicted transposase/invertase (TIGR01784 family)
VANHDKFFRALLREDGVAEALLRERLPQDTVALFAAKPELLPVSFINPALKERVSDVLLRVPLRGGEKAYVYCLVEHKRTTERAVMMQLLRYQCALYERLWREFPNHPLPAVVALVVYNGSSAWRGPRRFRDLLWGTPKVKRLALDFEVRLVDLRTERATKLSADRTLRGGLTALKVAASPRERQPAIIAAALRDLESEPSTRALFLHYLMDVVRREDRALVQRALRRQLEGDEMYSIADSWKASGYRKGRKLGLEKGIKKGLRQAITQVLEIRFKKLSPAHEERLADASAEELSELLARATKAKRLSDVFS